MLRIPYREYSVMPLGELYELIDCYKISNGMAKETDKYIPIDIE